MHQKLLSYLFCLLACVILASCDMPAASSLEGPLLLGDLNTALEVPSTSKAEIFTDNFKLPLTFSVDVPCANDGGGETVDFSGELHVLVHRTEDGSGGFHETVNLSLRGIGGIGQITGDKYEAIGVSPSTVTVKGGVVETDVFNFRIIGQGPGNDLQMHAVMHVTVTAEGSVTAVVDNTSETCG